MNFCLRWREFSKLNDEVVQETEELDEKVLSNQTANGRTVVVQNKALDEAIILMDDLLFDLSLKNEHVIKAAMSVRGFDGKFQECASQDEIDLSDLIKKCESLLS